MRGKGPVATTTTVSVAVAQEASSAATFSSSVRLVVVRFAWAA